MPALRLAHAPQSESHSFQGYASDVGYRVRHGVGSYSLLISYMLNVRMSCAQHRVCRAVAVLIYQEVAGFSPLDLQVDGVLVSQIYLPRSGWILAVGPAGGRCSSVSDRTGAVMPNRHF